MTVRRTNLLIVLACVLLALGLGAIAGTGLWAADRTVIRVQGANGRLEALHDLDGATGRYGRQVVDQLLFGYDRSGALQSSRNDMQRVLATLTRATREKLNLLVGTAELQNELMELEQVRRMTDLYNSIDAAATRSFSMIAQGEKQAAFDMASRQVDFPLTNEMQPLIDKAIAEERAEIGRKAADFSARRGELLGWGTALALGLLALIVVLSVIAQRTLGSAIRTMTDAAIGLARGETRVARTVGVGEFVPLAQALDEAGAALAAERSRRSGSDARLRAIDNDRGQFLADVGHQLRTPLTVLRGEADVALRNATPEGLQQSMGRVRAQAAELALLLDDLIDAARQEADAQPLVMARVGLGDVIAVAAEEGGVLAEPREVAIIIESPDSGPEIDADFRQLKQAVMIGIDNAVKHSPPGSAIRIAVTAAGSQAIIGIADEGPGIAEEDRPRLFERFYRGRAEGDLLNTGFGIGLSIARGIVDRHGGTVTLTNRTEGGALFEIVLPLGGRTA